MDIKDAVSQVYAIVSTTGGKFAMPVPGAMVKGYPVGSNVIRIDVVKD